LYVLLVASFIPALCGCDRLVASAPQDAAAPKAAGERVTKVVVVRPERGDVKKTTDQPGQVQAFETAPIQAKVAGYVESVNVDIGDRVKKGAVLATIAVPEIDAELEQKNALVRQAEADVALAKAAVAMARAEVGSARAKQVAVQAAIRRAEADVERWDSELKRIEELVRTSAITASLRDETRSKHQSAQAALAESKAQVQSAEAAVVESQAGEDRARADVAAAEARVAVANADAKKLAALVAYARIVAPFDGVVTSRSVDPGHLTRVGADSAPLFVVARDDRVRIVVHVPEADAPGVDPGDRAQVRVQALSGQTFDGKVARISWSLDQATRTLRAEIDLPGGEGRLRPGLYAYVTIVGEEHDDVLTLPATAVVKEDGRSLCYVIRDGKAVATPIETGLNDGTRIEVRSGLKGDEQVAASPASLRDGQPVQAAEPEKPAQPAAKR
jgi:RND family efflux transporter MFP subunit